MDGGNKKLIPLIDLILMLQYPRVGEQIRIDGLGRTSSVKQVFAIFGMEGGIKNAFCNGQAVHNNRRLLTVVLEILYRIIRVLRAYKDILYVHMVKKHTVDLAGIVNRGIDSGSQIIQQIVEIGFIFLPDQSGNMGNQYATAADRN